MSYISKIRNNYKYLKNLLPSLKYYYKITSQEHQLKDNHEYAFINLDINISNQEGGRFCYLLCKHFEKAGYNIILKMDFLFILMLDPEKKLLLKENYIFVRKIHTKKNTVVIDSKSRQPQIVNINYGFNSRLNTGHNQYILPYPMHPVQIDFYNHNVLKTLRTKKRTIKILFSGTWQKKQYQHSLDEYNVITRYEVLTDIIKKFNKMNLKVISHKQQFVEVLNNDNNNEKIIISDVKCADEDWLKLLSIADFFISPPGSKYPWCHNSIEAMAVGTIPILQYNHLFTPQLVHMENCIAYDNLSELQHALTTALTLETEEIERMRKNVIKYYDEQLSPETVAKKLKHLVDASESGTAINIPFIN